MQRVVQRVKSDKLLALEPLRKAQELYEEQIRILFKKKPPTSDEFYRRRASLRKIADSLEVNNKRSRWTKSRNKKEKRKRLAAQRKRKLELKTKL